MGRTKTDKDTTATGPETEMVKVELGGKLVEMPRESAAALKLLQAGVEPEATVDGEVVLVDGKVLVDYRGVIARPKGQREVEHASSPVIQPWPEADRLEFVAQPGLNRYEPAHYIFYRDNSPQIRDLIKDGELTALPRIPQNEQDLRSLISRTCDPGSLTWLRSVISERREELYDGAHDDDRAKILLEMIDRRLGSTNRLKYDAKPHRLPAVNYGKPVERGLGMGT